MLGRAVVHFVDGAQEETVEEPLWYIDGAVPEADESHADVEWLEVRNRVPARVEPTREEAMRRDEFFSPENRE
eukprot:CAMPEP_0174908440 /NCGR_PEP_ID=MMETSP0167-20121228/64792_1 /TAXON_ID=38298 /ORGANISM="Rhodella maculata, Strain CCMP736" /LENGTH=72 /DNA_ID=CAMNT_0016152195 /DNA_START=411 /DNA_END=629 /DNA_ORIENTATION=+